MQLRPRSAIFAPASSRSSWLNGGVGLPTRPALPQFVVPAPKVNVRARGPTVHPVAAQASQQLAKLLAQALLPLWEVQWAASFLVLHFVPLAFVRQHVTEPRLPQVDLAAHFFTTSAQALLARTDLACRRAQLT